MTILSLRCHRRRLLALLVGASLCPAAHAQVRTQVDFDGSEAPAGARSFGYAGSTWDGGRIETEGAPGLFASGAFFYAPQPDGAQVRFASPVGEMRFYYVHGFGVAPGTATAFDADGTVLATATSSPAGVKGAASGFTGFEGVEGIARVSFSGGAIDSVSWATSESTAAVTPADMAGAWVNTTHAPLLDGQGMLLEYLPDSGTLFLAWFTFADAPAPAAQRWLVAQGPVDGEVASLQLFAASGGSFNRPPNATQAAIGTMTISFQTCNRASVSFSIPAEELSGTFEITRARSLVSDAYACGSVATSR